MHPHRNRQISLPIRTPSEIYRGMPSPAIDKYVRLLGLTFRHCWHLPISTADPGKTARHLPPKDF